MTPRPALPTRLQPHAMPRAQRRPWLPCLPLLLLLLLLTACAGTLLPAPARPPARYTLDAGSTGAGPPAAGQTLALTVEMPRAAPGYDSRQMVYQRRPGQLEAFAFHEWVEPPAAMLAPLLVRALQRSGAFRVVLLAPSAVAGGWRLETGLLHLHQDFTRQPSQLRLSLRAVLLDAASRQALAWREFEISVPAAGDDPVAGAVAAQRAAQQLLAEVAAFCAAQARAAGSALTGQRPQDQLLQRVERAFELARGDQ